MPEIDIIYLLSYQKNIVEYRLKTPIELAYNSPYCKCDYSFAAKEIFFSTEMLDVKTETQLESLGKLPFPMVTAAFSMELALKGLLMQYKIKIPFEHDLKKLFSLLSTSVQSIIIQHYQSHNEFKGYPNMYIKIGSMDNIIRQTYFREYRIVQLKTM